MNKLTKKEMAILAELIDLNDMYFIGDTGKNPISDAINDNPEHYNKQKVAQKDFKNLYTKINKWRTK